MMRFPGRHKKLNDVFQNAEAPDRSHLNGEYRVNILMLPGYGIFGHRKVFFYENGAISGYNILFSKRWGRFTVEESGTAPPNLLNVAVINYERGENSSLIRRIRDYIRYVQNDDLYIGKAYYRVFGKTIFLGYFTLEKIDK